MWYAIATTVIEKSLPFPPAVTMTRDRKAKAVWMWLYWHYYFDLISRRTKGLPCLSKYLIVRHCIVQKKRAWHISRKALLLTPAFFGILLFWKLSEQRSELIPLVVKDMKIHMLGTCKDGHDGEFQKFVPTVDDNEGDIHKPIWWAGVKMKS